MSTMPTDSPTNSPENTATDADVLTAERPAEPPQNAPETPENTDLDQDTGIAEQLATVTAERDALAVQVARMEAAAKHDVPADLLTATTADALDAQAEKLAAYVNQRRRTPDFGGGNRGELISPPDPDPLRKALGR